MNKRTELMTKDDNILNMFPEGKILTAGKGPTDGRDWLSGLDIGCNFLISLKPEAPSTKIFLQEYTIAEKADFAVKLAPSETAGQTCWVNPKEFCKTFDLFEILNAPEEGE